MNPERWRRVEELLDVALDLSGLERAEYLKRECDNDVDLLADVMKVLNASERSDSLLDTSAARLAAPLVHDGAMQGAPPERVGPYRIERVLGEGGMGTVYLAHRDDGEFDQRVALKLVRRGLHLDARIVKRFREERQILAALNHPGIARLLDGGLTEDGLPYFAMEYIEGQPIDRYCSARALNVEKRLDLFARVGDALAHAHEKLIVHRDLKPTNILVTAAGEPKVLDFGIAKLLGPYDAAGNPATHTRHSERLLTPEYASPEQIRGEPVMVASDVYCLGVLLYELLTGQRPFRRAERSVFDLERAVLEEDPTRPSDVVREETARRQLKGDLDTIVLTAMSKEPERRYASAADMAADIRRHLAGQPVTARGTGRVYRLRRWSRRHRTAVASAIVVAVIATVGATVVAKQSAPLRLVTGAAARVVSDPELALDAELSPDGKRVAFVAGTGAGMRLFAKEIDGERTTPLAVDVPGFQRWPRWTPDGTHVSLLAGSRIYEVKADDSENRVLVAPDSGASFVGSQTFSPNGRDIAYTQDGAVFIRSVSGGAPRKLAGAPVTAHSLRWSPDGQFIALVSGNAEFALGTYPAVSIANLGNAGPSSMWIVPVRGGAPMRVGDGRALYASPVFMPDSRSLLYISNRDGARDVYRVVLDRNGKPTGEQQRITTGLGAHTISLSSDGRMLVYTTFRLVSNVWSVTKSEDRSDHVADATPITRGTQSVEGLALSPDGKTLTFDSDRNGLHHIYVVSSTGGEAKQITRDSVDEFMPHWSPSGREIAFHAFMRNGVRRLEVVSAEGGASAAVVAAPRNQRQPGWSPDGNALVFDAGLKSEGNVYVVERANGGGWGAARQLTTQGGGAARWAPSGQEILYVRSDGLWITSRDGGAGRQLLRVDPAKEEGLGNAEWSRDGKRVFFKRFDGEGRTSFWSIDATGGAPKMLVRVARELRSHRPEFATDGRRFFFTVTERVSDIWTMELRTVR